MKNFINNIQHIRRGYHGTLIKRFSCSWVGFRRRKLNFFASIQLGKQVVGKNFPQPGANSTQGSSKTASGVNEA